ncbi:MAG TPA: hypothetical protein VHO24_06005 [Opitutaceae bacterium]|nr:hypothetical protein [Opitutaceae bacterium]
MVERYLQAIHCEQPGLEEPAATRERLRDAFPKGATRRMTQLGLLLGSVLNKLSPGEDDTLVYASVYAESRALEEYLVSFPSASPTLFQTSIHPSAVQQAMIARQQPVRHFFPHTGRAQLVAHAVQSALLAFTPRSILCGGEERGTWLRERGAASDSSFAFALALSSDSTGALAKLSLAPTDRDEGELTLGEFFAALTERRPLNQSAAPGLWLTLNWQ